jgi:hypothetical protein
LAEAAPLCKEIDDLLRSKGVSASTAIVALAACLGTPAAIATNAGPFKGFLRIAHHYIDSACWVAYAEFKRSAKAQSRFMENQRGKSQAKRAINPATTA